MSFDWADYLKVAQELAGQCGIADRRDAKLRSSISRAYYAVFCLARRYLTTRESATIPAGGEAHEVVERKFRLVNPSVAENIKRLRIARNRADYNDEVPGLENACALSLSRAECAVNRIRLLLGP